MRYLLTILLFIFTCNVSLTGQTNSSCAGAAPFCSGSASQYPAGSGAGGNPPTLPPGSYLGCLGSAPYPAFFIIPVVQSGSLSIGMSAASDIDFISFGPFSGSPSAPGATYCNNLNAANVVPNAGASNGCSYSGSPTETLIIPNANAGDFYVLIITNFSQNSQQITVTPAGSGAIGGMTVTGTPSVCAGKTGTAIVNPGSNIQSVLWSGPNGVIGSNYTQSFPNLQSTTVFTITGTSVTGQSCTATHQISVTPTPTPIIFNNSPICVGDTARFTITGATSYDWQGPGFLPPATTASSLTPVTFSVNSAQVYNTGTYSVIATLNTCTAAASTYMLVKPNPTVTVSQAGDFCVGKSFNLTAHGANTYTWTGPNSFNYQGQNPLFLNNSFNMSGTYSVMGKSNGCVGGGNLLVTVNPLPNVTASTTGSVCQNSSYTLTAGGASTYSWTGPNLFTSLQGTIAIPLGIASNTGTYTVTGKDANGCVNTATVLQVIRPNPFINIYSMDACISKNLLLTADGGTYYKWTGPANFASTVQNPVIPNASLLNTGVYNVTVTSLYGCASTSSVNATVFMNPNVQVLGNMAVCRDKNFAFTGSGAINYKWLNSSGIVTELPTFVISSNSPDLQRTYTLVGTDGNFCSSFIPFYPVVNEKPVARIIPETVQSCAPFCTNISLDILSTNVTAYQWKFSDGIGHVGQTDHYSKCFTTPGITTLSVTLTDAKTCTSVITQTVEAFVSPKADFNHTPDKPTPNDNVVTFLDASQNSDVVSWSWDFYLDERGSQKDSSEKQNVTLTYKDVGNYVVYLKVTAANGCSDSITKLLVLEEDPSFFVPGAFTPNGDGLNDVFMPKAMGVARYEMLIYNRWGRLMFSTTDPLKGWDGKTNGSDVLPTDTYIYKCTVTSYDKNPKVYTGQFSLIK